jgi:hypothetical protein
MSAASTSRSCTRELLDAREHGYASARAHRACAEETSRFVRLGEPHRFPQAPIHTNGPVPDGWRVVEVWDSQADFEAWFDAYVKPAFPEGAPMPVIAFDELNDVVTA